MSLCGIGGLRVATPFQRRCTSPQKKGTTGINPYVSGFPPRGYLVPLLVSHLLRVVCLLVTCREIHLVAHPENLPLCQA
jgi:hypothetical protein